MAVSRDVGRIEAFSDAVFGFALTLLVVSLEVPRTYAEMMGTVRALGKIVAKGQGSALMREVPLYAQVLRPCAGAPQHEAGTGPN